MKREQFDKLSIEQQVIEFNKMYEVHKSIKKVCSEIGIGKTTVRDRFNKIGYHSIEGVGYVKNTNIPVDNKTSSTEPVNENKGHSDINMLDLEQLVNNLVENKFKELLKENPVHKDIELSPKCNGKVKYRAFGIYQQVLDEFVDYCKRKKPYSQIQLFSQALIEFKEKYK